jgi:predicted outer membrane protein
VLGIAKALNQGEVEHASAVQGRLFDPGVQSSCEMILQDHRAALVKIDQVAQATGIVPLESETSRELTKDVREEIADLQDDEGDELVDEFLSDQEGMHEKALKTFDEELLPAATNPKLVELLTELRASVASHLEHIKQLDDVR